MKSIQITSTLLTQDGGLTLIHNFYLKAERLPLLFHKFGVLLDEDTTKPIASNISNIDCQLAVCLICYCSVNCRIAAAD